MYSINELLYLIKIINYYEEGLVKIIEYYIKTYTFNTNKEFKNRVSLWCHDNYIDECNTIFGHISYWDTSNITDMASLFSGERFNDDISRWEVY